MAGSLVQFRVDDTEKLQAIQVCKKLGLNLQSYLRICMSRLVQEKGVPFSMKLEEKSGRGVFETSQPYCRRIRNNGYVFG